MDYKKKYENALEWARKVINGECGFIRKDVEEVFPELKESEDERIRKGLIKAVSGTLKGNTLFGTDITREEALSWLEKQGERPTPIDIDKMVYKYGNTKEDCTNGLPVNCQIRAYRQGINDTLNLVSNLEKQGKYETIWKPTKEQINALTHFVRSVGESGYASPYDNNTKLFYSLLTDLQALEKQDSSKVKPKFKSGQWIVNKGHSYLIAAIEDDRYLFEIGGYTHEQLNWEYIENADNNYHLWTLADAKNGDVLTNNGSIFIFKEEYMAGKPTAYCGLVDGVFHVSSGGCWTNEKCYPAIKEEQNLLFSKMKEAGWSWDSETKELCQSKVTKKSDLYWSEEDEERYKSCLKRLGTGNGEQPDTINTV